MELRYRDITLRDRREADIDDDVRWYTEQTQWARWDAPWEMQAKLAQFDPAAYRCAQTEKLTQPPEEPRRSLELDTQDGLHIGTVSSYFINDAFDWVLPASVQPGYRVYHALGLDICSDDHWGRGLGKQALSAWIQYHLEHGISDLYLQTWSGNLRMMRAAEHVGFVLCRRKQDLRQVRGNTYDGLTYRLDLWRFRRYLLEENLQDLALGMDAVQAVLAAYDEKPGFYEKRYQEAYLGTAPNFPICRRSPLERLVLLCQKLTDVERQFQVRGIPREIYLSTISDLSLRLELYGQRTKKLGLSKDDVIWFRHLVQGHIFKLHSLQFQLFHMVYLDAEGCGEDYMTFDPVQKAQLPPGTPVLNVHVQKGADLSVEAVEQSFCMARAFFTRYFPEHRVQAFLCYSWLLYPGLQELLSAQSHILQFARRFQIIGQARDNGEAIRRIYGKRYPRLSNYPQLTSLQRRAMGRFSSLGEACGIQPFGKLPGFSFNPCENQVDTGTD